MTPQLDIMTDDEVNRISPTGEEAGFGSLRTARGHLPLRAMEITGRITGLVSEVALRQTFINTFEEPMEATYIYPLPSRAAVTSFRLEVAGRIVEGVIKERQEARQEYDQAIQQGHRAAITEEERPGVFSMRVGNLMPGEEAVVRLTITGPLPFDGGEATFRFPLVVAPRYIPGNPLPGDSVGDGVAQDTDAVPDASRISPPVLLPGYPNPVRLGLSLTLDPAGMEISGLRSSLHVVHQQQEGKYHLLTLQPGERLNRDFILRFGVGQDAVRTGLTLCPDEDGGGEGTFQLTLVPPADLSRAQKPRDVIFLLDRSGSMGGWKMIAARRATARMVDTLSERDRFTVYAFDHSLETPPSFPGKDLAPATDRNRYHAVEFLAKLDARGGTEMSQPLEASADLLAGGYQDRERILVLITDGQVGNEDQILRSLAPRLKGIRIFTLGIDRAVNEGFLRRLAAVGGGSFELVESEDRLDEVMDKVHRRIATPVLTELLLELGELDVVPGTTVPSRMPDLFASAPVTVLGRYRGGASGAVVVKACDVAGGKWRERVPGTAGKGSAVSSVWARALIRELEDQFTIGRGDMVALERRILETSLRFSVLSRFTAYVAIDRAEKVNPDGEQHRVIQPVEAPDGWEMFDAKPEQAASMTRAGSITASAGFFEHAAASMTPGAPPAPSPSMAPQGPPPPCAAAPMSPPPMPTAGIPSQPDVDRRGGKASFKRRSSGPGLLRRAIDSLIGSADEECLVEADDTPELDLTPYHQRAADLLADYLRQDQGGARQRITALKVLVARLEQLMDDLASMGLFADMVKPLDRVLRTARDFVRDDSRSVETLDALSGRMRRALADFAGVPVDAGRQAPPKPGGRDKGPFWK